MNTFQTAAGAAVEATGPVTDAASPEKDWVIRIYRPAIDRKPSETVVKDLGREQDVREVLRWLDANGWILLKNLDLGNLEGEWDVSRDRVRFCCSSVYGRRYRLMRYCTSTSTES